MGENGILDTLDQKTYIGMRIFSLLIMLTALIMSSCSLPRFVILNDPLSPEEHINLGVAYERKGEIDLAIKEYESAAKKIPVAYLYLGNAYFEKKDYKRAEEYYKKAIEEDPKNADAYNNLAWLYYVTGSKLDEAERLVMKALELNPSGFDTYSDTLEKVRQKRK